MYSIDYISIPLTIQNLLNSRIVSTTMHINKYVLIEALKRLEELIEEKAKKHFSTINASQYHITELLQDAIRHINSLDFDEIEYEYPTTLNEIISATYAYLSSSSVPKTDDEKSKCGDLVKKITQILKYCISIPKKQTSLRSVSEKTIQDELRKTKEKREFIARQIDSEEKENPNSTTLSELKATYKELEEQFEQLMKEKKGSRNDDMLEKDWSQRIKESFDYLNSQTQHIKERRKSLEAEYHLFLYSLPLLFILLIIWYCKLHGHLIGIDEVKIDTFPHLLPFYIPIPMLAALFWICIVQKNRVNKLLMAIDEELFRINYLQGLLLATNKLAPTPQLAITRINKALDILTNSFLHQTESYNMIDKLNTLSSQDDDIAQNLSTIKDLITALKK